MRLPRAVLFAGMVATGVASAAANGSTRAAAVAEQQPPRLVLVDDASELDAALAARTPPRDIAVRMTAVTLPDADPARARFLIVAEIGGTQAGASAPGSPAATLASVAYSIEDERGQVRAHALRRRSLQPTPGGSLEFTEAVTLPAGAYRVKLAAMRNGKVGTAQAAVTVRMQTAGTLRFGDLVLGEVAGDDLAASVGFDRRIRGDRLVASLPFAAAPGPSDVVMVVEVARDAAGAAMMSAPAVAPAGEEPVRVAQAVLDVRALPPGDYVARVVVSTGGKEAGRATAAFTRERAAGASPTPPAAGRVKGGAAPVVSAVAFRADDVLDARVLKPFLDDLAARASDRSKPAIEQAKAGHFAEAAQAAAGADPNDPAKPFLQGLSLFSQKQLQAASEAFRETLRAAPDFFVGAFYIGACYAAGGRDLQAVNAWQTSLVGLDQYPVVFRLLSEAQTRMGQPDRALETLDEALAKWPDNPALRTQAARAALDGRRYERVVGIVDEGMTRQPAPDLLFVGMQAIFEQVSQRADPAGDETVARMKRYREAYAAAGGTQQALVAEWAAAVERKK